jgi:hypothetical protein|tara:strand:- start:429 stop:815 length:387 start_codon:yes stop_codon:yes gene_type:complete
MYTKLVQQKDLLTVHKAIEFIETPIFTRQIKEIATDDELRELQRLLIAAPERGALIQGTGGLRKVRMPLQNRGKSGGARVIYFLATREVIYLILAYPKSEKDSLTSAEKTKLKILAQQLKGDEPNERI